MVPVLVNGESHSLFCASLSISISIPSSEDEWRDVFSHKPDGENEYSQKF